MAGFKRRIGENDIEEIGELDLLTDVDVLTALAEAEEELRREMDELNEAVRNLERSIDKHFGIIRASRIGRA